MVYIKPFKEFCGDSSNTTEDFINHYIDEAMSVSYETNSMVKIVEDEISKLLKNANNIEVSDFDINGYGCKKIKFKTPPTILVFGKECLLDIELINIEKNLLNNDLKNISRNYTRASINHKEPDYKGDLKNDLEISYILGATIVLHKMKMCLYSRTSLSHELRHCYIYLKSRENSSVEDEINKIIKNKSWIKIYDYCDNYLRNCDGKSFRYGEEFYKIVYALYSCDIEELDSFVQQAYDSVKLSRCNTYDEIKSELKNTDLWIMICNIKDAMSILNKDGYKEKFNSLRFFKENKVLPTASEIYSLLNKVYKKSYSRYGKLLMLLIDEFDEDNINEKLIKNNIDMFFILGRNKDSKKYYI